MSLTSRSYFKKGHTLTEDGYFEIFNVSGKGILKNFIFQPENLNMCVRIEIDGVVFFVGSFKDMKDIFGYDITSTTTPLESFILYMSAKYISANINLPFNNLKVSVKKYDASNNKMIFTGIMYLLEV